MTSTVVTFGEWRPDAAPLALDGLTVARNCAASDLPHYEPWPALAGISDALVDPVLGAAAGKSTVGDAYAYAGTGTALWQLGNDGTWADVTNTGGAYTDTAGERWSFTTFGEYFVAAKLGDPIQFVVMGSASEFDDLGSNVPEARYLGVVKDFLVAGYTYDSVDGTRPLRVRWGPIGDPDGDWTPDALTQADFQDLPTGDAISGIVSGEFGLLICERDVYRMTFVGAPLVFQFDNIAPGRGCVAPGSIATDGRMTIFLSEDGFYATNGAEITPIGAGKIDRWFSEDADPDRYGAMSALMDPTRKLYMLAYVSADSDDDEPDSLLVYNWVSQRWTYVRAATQVLCAMMQPAIDMDSLDDLFPNLDTAGVSLDSRIFSGGARYRGAISPAGRLATFSGAPLAARLETGEAALGGVARRSMIRAVRPLCDGTRTVAVGSRDDQAAVVTWGADVPTARSGTCPQRADARFHRVRLDVSGAWTKVQGVEVDHTVTAAL